MSENPDENMVNGDDESNRRRSESEGGAPADDVERQTDEGGLTEDGEETDESEKA